MLLPLTSERYFKHRRIFDNCGGYEDDKCPLVKGNYPPGALVMKVCSEVCSEVLERTPAEYIGIPN